jgi:hypothetical protein
MGKAFAIVFGSTSALALVLALCLLAVRPLLRSSSQSQPEQTPITVDPSQVTRIENVDSSNVSQATGLPPAATGARRRKDQQGKYSAADVASPAPPAGYHEVPAPGQTAPAAAASGFAPIGSVCNCDKAGCFICDSQKNPVAWLPRDEISKAQWVPVQPTK